MSCVIALAFWKPTYCTSCSYSVAILCPPRLCFFVFHFRLQKGLLFHAIYLGDGPILSLFDRFPCHVTMSPTFPFSRDKTCCFFTGCQNLSALLIASKAHSKKCYFACYCILPLLPCLFIVSTISRFLDKDFLFSAS